MTEKQFEGSLRQYLGRGDNLSKFCKEIRDAVFRKSATERKMGFPSERDFCIGIYTKVMKEMNHE